MKAIKQMWKNVNNWWIHAKGIGNFFLLWKALKHKKLLKTQGQIQTPDYDAPIFCWEILESSHKQTFMKMDIAWSAQSHLMGSLSNPSPPPLLQTVSKSPPPPFSYFWKSEIIRAKSPLPCFLLPISLSISLVFF